MSDSEEIRKLPMEYPLYGNKFKQIKKTDKAVMYAAKEGESTIFEVFVLKIAKATVIKMNNSTIPARERIPGNEDFGKWAWTTRDEERANLIFDEIEQGLRPMKVEGTENIEENEAENTRETD